ncbi:MAG: glycosyltransferase family 4 protein [Promethearchaeati archaeon SRVP18_Atabeyarchaeia-1]
MKIAIVTDSYAPYVDGIARYLDRIVQVLTDRGHKVLILGPGFSLHRKFEYDKHGVGIVRNPTLRMLRLNEYYPSLPSRVCATILRWADVIFTPSPAPLGIYSILYARRRRKPITFFCSHDESVLIGKGVWLPLPKRVVDGIVRRLYLRCNVIFFAIQKFREKITRLRIPEERLVYNPYGIEYDFFSSADKVTGRRDLGISPDAKVVLYLARMSEEKNARTLIKTIPEVSKHFHNLYYVFVGHGPKFDEYRKMAIDTAKGTRAKVIFTGQVKFEDLPQAYVVGDVFVHPSLQESQSFTVLEAMCTGVPIITGVEVGRYSYLKEGYNTLFLRNVLDDKELSEKIIELLGNENKRRQMARNSVATARQFTWDAHVDKLEEGFKRAIKEMESKQA